MLTVLVLLLSLRNSAWARLCGQVLAGSARPPAVQLLRFLNDAHRPGLLRRSGAVYQFRHPISQDRLAADTPEGHPRLASPD
jgi:hypothetical protein